MVVGRASGHCQSRREHVFDACLARRRGQRVARSPRLVAVGALVVDRFEWRGQTQVVACDREVAHTSDTHRNNAERIEPRVQGVTSNVRAERYDREAGAHLQRLLGWQHREKTSIELNEFR